MVETTHNLIIQFGKHKGERWTRVPISYLKWLANEGLGENSKIAKMELERRGSVMPRTLQLSGHSVDRASQITDEWKKTGVYSWLQSKAEMALFMAEGKEVVEYGGFKFCFAYGEYYPTLKTIMKIE